MQAQDLLDQVYKTLYRPLCYTPTGNNVNVFFGDIIRNIQPNLMYRCAGFIDTTKLQIESKHTTQQVKAQALLFQTKI